MRLLGLVVFLVGCGGTGMSGPAIVGEEGLTRGEVCAPVAAAVCGHCDTSNMPELCRAFLSRACCDGAACAVVTSDTQSDVDACVADFASWPCSDYKANHMPPSCDALK